MRSIFAVYDGSMAKQMYQLFTEGAALIMSDDLSRMDAGMDGTLVEIGLPIELSIALRRAEPLPRLRFAAEPCAYLPIFERQALVASRIVGLLTLYEQGEHARLFEDIYRRLHAPAAAGAGIGGWLLHVSLTVERPPACRVYLAPVPAVGWMKCQSASRGRAFVKSVLDRVSDVFELCEMDDHIPLLRRIYELAVGEDGIEPAENFITFLGADFRRGEPVGLKVYFNPQALRKVELCDHPQKRRPKS